MNEQELRALVREAIDRHLDSSKSGRAPFSAELTVKGARPLFEGHASHIMLEVAPGSEIGEGMCVIEPAVGCNHCGFCRSYGH